MIEPAVARRIRLVGLDVDGVLTDGGVYIGGTAESPMELKRFDVQDSIGIKLLQAAGIKVVIVSGRYSEATQLRAQELGIAEVFQDRAARKLPAFTGMLQRAGVKWEESAFVGDDLPDIPLLKRVGLPVTVQNAVADVRGIAAYVTSAAGGHGAVREFVEKLLRAQGRWNEIVFDYLSARDDAIRGSALAD